MAPGKPGKGTGASENPSVTLFREYLRIDTVHPKPDYGEDGETGWGVTSCFCPTGVPGPRGAGADLAGHKPPLRFPILLKLPTQDVVPVL
uniref:Uncharacterized protein n=1 Tax=Malurus cyaneus samueli TaxID=2593467 RepID=A0A8C5UBD8_9PASS